MRTSSYTIFAQIPRSEEQILVHGYTGAIDIVSQRLISNLKEENFGALTPKEIEVLSKRGYITTKSKEEEYKRVELLARLFHKKASRFHLFMFLVSYDCNFRCPYCFESSISAAGENWSGETFTKILVDAAYEVVDKINFTSPWKSRIILYGGEPLLVKNSNIVHYIVDSGLKRGYKFGAITNGYEVDSYQDIIGKDAVNFLQISLDGGSIVHNNRRRHYTGEGTFYKIFENISLALELGAFVNVRINIDEKNISQLFDLVKFIFSNKFNERSNFQCYISVVRNYNGNVSSENISVCSNGLCEIFPTVSKRKVLKFLESFFQIHPEFSFIQGPDYWLKSEIKHVIQSRGALQFRGSFCGVTGGNQIFDPRGDIYTCWGDVGKRSVRIGRFWPALSYVKEQLQEWKERTITNLSICSKCKYALFCGGGAAHWQKQSITHLSTHFVMNIH